MTAYQNVSSYQFPAAITRAQDVRVRIDEVEQIVGATHTTNYVCAA